MANMVRLEIAWTLVIVALLAGVTAYSTVVLYHEDAVVAHPSEYVNVYAHQWYFEFCYSNATCSSTPAPNAGPDVSGGTLWVQPNTTVQLNVTSVDVIHSLYIPGLGFQINAIAGRTNAVDLVIPNVAPGTQYIIECTEFCGTGHGQMRSWLVVA